LKLPIVAVMCNIMYLPIHVLLVSETFVSVWCITVTDIIIIIIIITRQGDLHLAPTSHIQKYSM